MIYVFADPEGKVLELDYDIGQCPVRIGDEHPEHPGFMRVPISPQAAVSPNFHFTSKQLPLHYPFAKRHNARGEPQFDSIKEVRECIAGAKQAGEPLAWD